jgi:hypothetical protein
MNWQGFSFGPLVINAGRKASGRKGTLHRPSLAMMTRTAVAPTEAFRRYDRWWAGHALHAGDSRKLQA